MDIITLSTFYSSVTRIVKEDRQSPPFNNYATSRVNEPILDRKIYSVLVSWVSPVILYRNGNWLVYVVFETSIIFHTGWSCFYYQNFNYTSSKTWWSNVVLTWHLVHIICVNHRMVGSLWLVEKSRHVINQVYSSPHQTHPSIPIKCKISFKGQRTDFGYSL